MAPSRSVSPVAESNKRIKLDEPSVPKKKKARRSRRERFDGDAQAQARSNEPRLPKRQVALFMSYCGSRYRGMQFQPDNDNGSTNTIENAIFDAMVKVGAVSKDNSNDPVKVSLARAARTDAGVHAAGNLISLKFIPHIPGVPDVIAGINEQLPSDIRIWGYVRTLNSFNARTNCDSRKYTYYFPSYMLIPPKPSSPQYNQLPQSVLDTLDYSFWSRITPDVSELSHKRSFRVSQTTLDRLRLLASKYEGTHNFHNFTVGRDFKDSASQRFMKQIIINDPVVHGDTEWISVLFHGQSFMLHQIRKMMSALIMLTRTNARPSLLDSFYSPVQISIPKSPSLGLLLEYPLFGVYNQRVQEYNAGKNGASPGAEDRQPLDWTKYETQMEHFKQEWIYRGMRGVEERDALFNSWLVHLDAYSGTDFAYLSSADGQIPPEAVRHRTKGSVPPAHPFKEQRKFDATIFDLPGCEDVAATSQPSSTSIDDEDPEVEAKLDKKKLEEMEG